MDKHLTSLPVIDWEQAIKLAGKREFAEEMLALLMRDLVIDVNEIKKTYLAQNFVEMQKQVHKLHGALCYCGLPRLKTIVSQLETELKNHIMEDLPQTMDSLDLEVKLLLEHYSRLT